MSSKQCTRSFFDVPCEELAKALLGQILVRRLDDGDTLLRGRIVETECYLGVTDKASHSFGGKRTPRNEAMFAEPGTAYVYMSYGMYHCFNISSHGEGAAVLIRSIEPIEGFDIMTTNRQVRMKAPKDIKKVRLCNGPAKICLAFDINKAGHNKMDMCSPEANLWIEDGDNPVPVKKLVISSRIGIASVGEEWANKLFRFYELGNQSVSVRDKKRELLC